METISCNLDVKFDVFFCKAAFNIHPMLSGKILTHAQDSLNVCSDCKEIKHVSIMSIILSSNRPFWARQAAASYVIMGYLSLARPFHSLSCVWLFLCLFSLRSDRGPRPPSRSPALDQRHPHLSVRGTSQLSGLSWPSVSARSQIRG